MRILVTGGSGFLGARVIAELIADGHTVLALGRSTAARDAVGELGAQPIAGDLEAPDGLSLPPIDAVVHAAARFRFTGASGPFLRANVQGTQALLAAAQEAGARTFVYISAGAVVMDGRGTKLTDVDEAAPTHPHSFSRYIASKARGEALVLAADKPGFRTIAIRPPAIWGHGDAFSRELPRAVETGQFAFVGGGDYPFSTCHVDNVVEATSCALQRGRGGRAYFVADSDRVTFREFVASLASTQHLSIDGMRSVPYPLAFMLGGLMELVNRVRCADADPALSRSVVRMIGREFTVNDSAARRELGYVARLSRAEGLDQLTESRHLVE